MYKLGTIVSDITSKHYRVFDTKTNNGVEWYYCEPVVDVSGMTVVFSAQNPLQIISQPEETK